jgi:hypothetical protein
LCICQCDVRYISDLIDGKVFIVAVGMSGGTAFCDIGTSPQDTSGTTTNWVRVLWCSGLFWRSRSLSPWSQKVEHLEIAILNAPFMETGGEVANSS